MLAKSLELCATLCDLMDCNLWDSPGKNMGVVCHALLQGILPVQGPNPNLLYFLQWQVGSLPLAPPGLPSILFLFHALWVSVIRCKYVYKS